MRDKKIDNIKGLLIILVVLGHMLEFCTSGTNNQVAELIIYTFHMPAFFFFMGMVAKPNAKNIVNNAVLYVVFQIAYYLFKGIILKGNASLQFIKPYWLLWFLLVYIYYGILVIVIDKYQIKITYLFIASIIVSLFIGYAENIGYAFSLSRAFSFLPYFFAGMLFKDSKHRNKKHIIVAIMTGVFVLVPCFSSHYYSIYILFGSYSYTGANYNPLIKASLYVVAFTYIFFLYMYMPDKELPVLNKIGKNTLPIYLLHGFFILYFSKHNFLIFGSALNTALVIGISFFLALILCNCQIPGINWHSKEKSALREC